MRKRPVPAFLFLLAAALGGAAPAAGADAAALPNPLKNIAAGQWARYRVNTLFGVAEQKQTVVAVTGEGDDRVITIKTEMSLDDEVVDSREEAATYRKLLDDQSAALDGVGNPEIAPGETEFAGAHLPAVTVKYTQDGQNYTLFLSERIPLAGVVRLVMEGADEPVVELLDYGD